MAAVLGKGHKIGMLDTSLKRQRSSQPSLALQACIQPVRRPNTPETAPVSGIPAHGRPAHLPRTPPTGSPPPPPPPLPIETRRKKPTGLAPPPQARLWVRRGRGTPLLASSSPTSVAFPGANPRPPLLAANSSSNGQLADSSIISS